MKWKMLVADLVFAECSRRKWGKLRPVSSHLQRQSFPLHPTTPAARKDSYHHIYTFTLGFMFAVDKYYVPNICFCDAIANMYTYAQAETTVCKK
jgi:hypothetical protein